MRTPHEELRLRPRVDPNLKLRYQTDIFAKTIQVSSVGGSGGSLSATDVRGSMGGSARAGMLEDGMDLDVCEGANAVSKVMCFVAATLAH